MREIVFRAKHYKTKQWVYGIPFRNPVNGLDNDAYHPQIIPEINKMHSTIDSCSVIEETISQYTGLTDKHGTKIFEGDICHFYGGECYNGCWEANHTCIIEINHECLWYLENAENVEIIGNIYDNPELLGGTDNECKKV